MKQNKLRPRKYVCAFEDCGKAYSRPSLLEQHRRTHVNERPFQCEICGKRFFRISHLKSHKWTHSDEKPLNCSICSKGFVTGQQLSRHINTHHSLEVEKSQKNSKTITRATKSPVIKQSSQLHNEILPKVTMTPGYPIVTNSMHTMHYYQDSQMLQIHSYSHQLQLPPQVHSMPTSAQHLYNIPSSYPQLQQQLQQAQQQPTLQQEPSLPQDKQEFRQLEQRYTAPGPPFMTSVSQLIPPQLTPQSVPQFPLHGILGPLNLQQEMNPYVRYNTPISNNQPLLIRCPYECGFSFVEGKELTDHISEHQIMELDTGTYSSKMDNQNYASYGWAGNPSYRESEQQTVVGV